MYLLFMDVETCGGGAIAVDYQCQYLRRSKGGCAPQMLKKIINLTLNGLALYGEQSLVKQTSIEINFTQHPLLRTEKIHPSLLLVQHKIMRPPICFSLPPPL